MQILIKFSSLNLIRKKITVRRFTWYPFQTRSYKKRHFNTLRLFQILIRTALTSSNPIKLIVIASLSPSTMMMMNTYQIYCVQMISVYSSKVLPINSSWSKDQIEDHRYATWHLTANNCYRDMNRDLKLLRIPTGLSDHTRSWSQTSICRISLGLKQLISYNVAIIRPC